MIKRREAVSTAGGSQPNINISTEARRCGASSLQLAKELCRYTDGLLRVSLYSHAAKVGMSSSASRPSADTLASPGSTSAPNQYPFPQVSPSQSSTLDLGHHRRRGSTASSTTSIAGVLDKSRQETASIVAGNNAISTLLQRPIIRTGALSQSAGPLAAKQPSAKDIPPVTLSNIPHVDPAVFKSYLKQAGALYDAFQRAKEGDAPISDSLAGRSKSYGSTTSSQHPAFQSSSPLRAKSGIPSSPLLENVPTFPTSPIGRPQARRQATGKRRGPPQPAPLSTIPKVYFEPDFHLENPRIFDIVSERSEIVRPAGDNGVALTPGTSGRKVLATNAILQEKLSWYMDTVEMHLISSISTASASFFAALGNLRELHTEAAASVAKIKALRSDLKNLDENMAQGGLKVVALKRRGKNMRKLGNAVLQLEEVVDSVTRCEYQISNGDVQEALSGLVNIESLIAGGESGKTSNQTPISKRLAPEQLIDLRGIKALEGSGDDIAFLRQQIGKTFESRFLDALLGDLRRHVDSVPSETTLERWENAYQRPRGRHGRKPSVFPAFLQMD